MDLLEFLRFPQRAFGIFRAQLDVFVRHLKTLDWKLDRFHIEGDGSTLRPSRSLSLEYHPCSLPGFSLEIQRR